MPRQFQPSGLSSRPHATAPWPSARIESDRRGLRSTRSEPVVHRQTHLPHAAAAGVDLRTLAGRIGHNDLTMLQKHYAALVGSTAMEAADKIEKAFSRVTSEA